MSEKTEAEEAMREADEEIKRFEGSFVVEYNNEPLSRPELAILRTYLLWSKLKKNKPAE